MHLWFSLREEAHKVKPGSELGTAQPQLVINYNDLIIANSPTGLNVLKFSSGNNIFKMFAKVKQLQVYKTALTDEQLIQLTGESGTDFYESYAEMAAALNYTIQ